MLFIFYMIVGEKVWSRSFGWKPLLVLFMSAVSRLFGWVVGICKNSRVLESKSAGLLFVSWKKNSTSHPGYFFISKRKYWGVPGAITQVEFPPWRWFRELFPPPELCDPNDPHSGYVEQRLTPGLELKKPFQWDVRHFQEHKISPVAFNSSF